MYLHRSAILFCLDALHSVAHLVTVNLNDEVNAQVHHLQYFETFTFQVKALLDTFRRVPVCLTVKATPQSGGQQGNNALCNHWYFKSLRIGDKAMKSALYNHHDQRAQ